jgi:hypothetical protein
LTCLWRDTTAHELPPVVNHESWSDESLCIRKKVQNPFVLFLFSDLYTYSGKNP